MFLNENNESTKEVEMIIGNYFQGYLKAEPERLSNAFHPCARLFCTDEKGNVETTEMSDWLKSLTERRAKGDIREADTRIDGIDIVGDTAVAKVTLIFKAFQFTDYLSLLRLDAGWKIINKIYTVETFERSGI